MVWCSPSPPWSPPAVYAARLTLKKTPLWTDTLKHHTGFTEAQLMDAAKIPVASYSTAPDNKLKVVYKKYSSEKDAANMCNFRKFCLFCMLH
ncbi:cyclin-B1-1-like isoform X2 [Triticum dicoccoides]|uniref:cyclin-B1-1-like isoform X2 n=1 Tax=Triticum dicoccoides TaxID=85692 RepID=UPI00188F9545|nr:cyclin-B1-1-like isoform X2 [Triticum dicoccoides]